MSGKQKRGKMIILSSILLATLAAAFVIVRLPSFGRLPQGERLERIRQSPNYRDGRFRNQEAGPMMTGDKSRLRGILEFLFRKREGLRPQDAVPAIRTDLRALDSKSNLLVWFGHSSYLIQAEGRRTLVDPVFRSAAPLSLLNRPFKGTDIYRPEEMPDIDYLIVTHDHWDHLDYRTVRELKERIGTVICPLGVGEHFEYWGFDPAKIVELDWHEQQTLGDGFTVRCLPSRHFSGRGRSSNQTLWGSFLLQTPARKIYMGGDGGYGCHFAEIGEEFPDIDLAVLENGQYDEAWKYIHTMPDQLAKAAKELGARRIMTVHHSKYALAKHRWDEPLATEAALAADTAQHLLRPEIGEVVPLETPQPERAQADDPTGLSRIGQGRSGFNGTIPVPAGLFRRKPATRTEATRTEATYGEAKRPAPKHLRRSDLCGNICAETSAAAVRRRPTATETRIRHPRKKRPLPRILRT